MATAFALGEATVLGLLSGPACVASCGPMIVPSLLAEHGGLRINSRYLSLFLATRLLGYLLFATIAWEIGALCGIKKASPGTDFLSASQTFASFGFRNKPVRTCTDNEQPPLRRTDCE